MVQEENKNLFSIKVKKGDEPDINQGKVLDVLGLFHDKDVYWKGEDTIVIRGHECGSILTLKVISFIS